MQNFFKLKEHKTDVKTEIIAGFTTFMTMAYILAVNPAILSGTGMDKDAIFFATAVAAGVVTIAMGLFVNFPIALAPGMGLNAYFAVVAAKGTGVMPWQAALGAVFISGIIFFLLTITNVRQLLIVAVPNSIKKAITVGIGLFITLIGLKMSGITSVFLHLGPSMATIGKTGFGTPFFFEWDVKMGAITHGDALLAIIGLAITSILMARRVKGSLLWGILATTLIGIPMGITKLAGLTFGLPNLSNLTVGQLDIMGAFNYGIIAVIMTFTFVELFDTFGTLVGTANKAGLLDEHGNNPKIGRAMLVDAFGVSFGALMGTSTLTAYIESAAGIGEGGRTGLTAVTTGVLFLLSIFLAPLFLLIPGAATAPALIIVGVLMVGAIREIDFDDFTEAMPAFMVIALMPFTWNIANGIAGGIIFYCILKTATGKLKDVHWLMWLLTILIIARYVFLGGE